MARTNNAPQEQLQPTHQPQLPALAHPKAPFNQMPFQNERKTTIRPSHYSLQVHSDMEFIIPPSPHATSFFVGIQAKPMKLLLKTLK